jgi:hypothetical protein
MSDEDPAVIASQVREIQALRDRLVGAQRRARDRLNEARSHKEYAKQLLRQVTWLVGELRESRTEQRRCLKHNQMLLRGFERYQERERVLREERDEAFKLRDAAVRLLAESSISSTEKE